MSMLSSDFGRVVKVSERVAWSVDDVFPPGTILDMDKWFMPKSMFASMELDFLSEHEKRVLNQIYGNAYAHLFYYFEAYVIDLAMRHAQAELYGNDDNLRAMLRFAEEEVKHQQMFLRFGEMFRAHFHSPVELLPDPQALASVVLGKSPMGALLITLHLEIITQTHFVDCMRDDAEMDPQFSSLFRHHWMEEAQHAKLDALELGKLLVDASPEMVQQALDDYVAIIDIMAGAFGRQAELDVTSFERATGRTLDRAQRAAVAAAQRKTYHRTFLRSGLTNASFLEFLAENVPAALPVTARAAEVLQ
jgi:hypothetical protein